MIYVKIKLYINWGGVALDNFVYLDNAATSRISEQALSVYNSVAKNNFANPSSLYSLGVLSEEIINSAKSKIARKIKNAKANNILFTSGGTESNNTSIKSVAFKNSRFGKHIVTGKMEHPSVLEPIKELEALGFDVTYITPTKNGYEKSDIEKAIKKDTILVSLMTVNNETGIYSDLSCVKEIIKEKESRAVFHSDCVQAFLKMPINAEHYDLISLSAHKIKGPKGIGALVFNKPFMPYITGGGQQKGLRSGTEPIELIASFAAAAEIFVTDGIKELNLYARNALKKYVINSPSLASPFILNFSVPNYKSETLLHFLESKNIFVSSGSACAKGEKSYVLSALNVDNNLIDSALRISFSSDNTKEDIDKLVAALLEAEKELVKIRR